ncbi:MAG: hypothetical protein N2321_03415 [Melioribacteraceae bacterium]|nr:hypothetical protein [Melioribacteraceae bacterium]
MKKLILFCLMMNSILFAQFDFSASMGLEFKNSSSYRDYLNTSFANANQLPVFKSAVSFSLEGDYKLNSNYALGLEYNVLIDSYNSNFGVGGLYELSYNIYRPSLIGYYYLPGKGYQFKFGLGGGLRYAFLTERIFTETEYKSSGFGFLIKAEGNTMLSENFYALIGAKFRVDSIGDLENNGKYIVNRATKENLNMNSISFGIYLGLTYTF